MSSAGVKQLWNADQFHDVLLQCLNHAFQQLKDDPNLEADWIGWRTVPGTKTMVRQAVLLGKGGPGRTSGGFWIAAERYAKAEKANGISNQEPLWQRCSFERYVDFAFYNGGGWYDGRKRTLMVAEVESNPVELLGHMSDLIVARCPLKYFFITEAPGILDRITTYSAEPSNDAVDWGGTTYFLVEMPNTPTMPSTWITYRADVLRNGDPIDFRKFP